MEEDNKEGRIQIYELGYHIVSTVPENDLPQEVNSLRNFIEEKKGIIISDDFPKIRPLAYTLFKAVGGVKRKFDNAYFGWIKFEVDSSVIKDIREWAEKNPHILRFLLIKTVREKTLYTQRIVQVAKMQGAGSKKEDGDQPKMTTEEIDKTIEEMVKE